MKPREFKRKSGIFIIGIGLSVILIGFLMKAYNFSAFLFPLYIGPIIIFIGAAILIFKND